MEGAVLVEAMAKEVWMPKNLSRGLGSDVELIHPMVLEVVKH